MENGRMTGYCGMVQSIMRRGRNAYQVTLGVYTGKNDEKPRFDGPDGNRGQLLVYRADITIEDDRTILFPDRELDKCMDAFYDSGEIASPAEGLEKEWMVGRIADRICRELRSLLLERGTIELT
jgi:hypothetical protein